MRPFLIHILILLAFATLGIAGLVTAALAPDDPGGLFGKYDFVVIYWIILGYYALGSTLIVLSVAVIQRIRRRPFTRLAVILCHVLPIALIWVFLTLGVHDWIQDARKQNDFAVERQIRPPQPERKRPPVSATPKPNKPAYNSSSGPIGAVEQKQ